MIRYSGEIVSESRCTHFRPVADKDLTCIPVEGVREVPRFHSIRFVKRISLAVFLVPLPLKPLDGLGRGAHRGTNLRFDVPPKKLGLCTPHHHLRLPIYIMDELLRTGYSLWRPTNYPSKAKEWTPPSETHRVLRTCRRMTCHLRLNHSSACPPTPASLVGCLSLCANL